MKWNTPSHPVWFSLNLAMVLLFATVFSWLTASSFDETEGKLIAGVFGGWLTYEGIKYKIRKTEQ